MKINIEFDIEYLKQMVEAILEAYEVCWGEGIGPDLDPYIIKLATTLDTYYPGFSKRMIEERSYMFEK